MEETGSLADKFKRRNIARELEAEEKRKALGSEESKVEEKVEQRVEPVKKSASRTGHTTIYLSGSTCEKIDRILETLEIKRVEFFNFMADGEG